MVGSHAGHGRRKHQPSNLKSTCGLEGIPFGPTMAMLGTVADDGRSEPKMWMDSVSENPANGSTEIWEIHNFTADAHPIHVHLVQFEVVEREANGIVRPAEAWESGLKDTVVSYPGEITRIKATFDLVGRYVWHCHILAHEDNEMMRPYVVGNAPEPGSSGAHQIPGRRA
jgi:spore coat protein A, manganese oxidase